MIQTGDTRSVLMRLDRDGQQQFLLALTHDGMVKRMGYTAPDRPADELRTGRLPGAFAELMRSVPPALLARAGTYEAEGTDGPRCEWRIEFAGNTAPAVFHLRYHEHSAGPPRAIAEVVQRAEELTSAWYAGQLAGEEEDMDEAEPGREAGTRAAPVGSARSRADSSAPAEPAGPAASRKRIVLAVVLDFILLAIPYQYLGALNASEDAGVGVPPGGGLVLFAFVELILLRFVRRSPAYWALGVSAAFAHKPVVDRRQKERESWPTMIIAYLTVVGGATGMTSWIQYHTPAPYFGLDLAAGPSIAFTVLLSTLMLVSGILIYRTDLRGVMIGAGNLVLSLFSVVFGLGQWDIWFGQELVNQATQNGRPVDEAMLEAMVGWAEPIMFITMAVQAVLLAVCWKLLSKPR